MKKKRLVSASVGAIAMLLLILDSKTSVQGTTAGLELCIRTLIPSLFPFLVASALLTGALSGQALPIVSGLGRICGIPRGADSLLAVGILGGYPVGAECVAQSWKNGAISKDDAQRMLAFSNNAGPSFLFGIVGTMFSDRKTVWFLWVIHIISALAVGIVTGRQNNQQYQPMPCKPVSLPEALDRSVRTMGRICGWVMLFRLILAFLEKWVFWALTAETQVFLAGLLELSNGCILLDMIQSEGTRFTVAGMILALGGLCAAMQTVSVTAGLSLRYYFPGKLLQCAITVILCCVCQFLFPQDQRLRAPGMLVTACLTALLLGIRLRGLKKSSSNPAIVGV